MLIKIKSWFGRLGNNIIQVKNAIQFALQHGYNIEIPKHRYFNTTYIEINKENDNSKIFHDQIFFDVKNCGNIQKTRDILRKIFIMPINNLQPFGNNDVVVYIRSGDLFINNPPSKYILPPLSYYTNILDKYENIYLVAEDIKNPCIPALLRKYPHIKYKKSSLCEDICTILRAQNIVCSFGTLVPSILLLSKNVKTVHKTSDDCIENRVDIPVKIIRHDYNDYKKKIGTWKNTEEQRKMMLAK